MSIKAKYCHEMVRYTISHRSNISCVFSFDVKKLEVIFLRGHFLALSISVCLSPSPFLSLFLSLYLSLSLQSLRIILSCIESHANRYRRYIVPLLSCSIDFYCRVFVLVYTSAYEVKKSARCVTERTKQNVESLQLLQICIQPSSKLSMVYNCNGCGTFHLQPLGRQDTGRKG